MKTRAGNSELTHNNDMRVDFILIGAQKSGTTSLAYQLRQHPQIGFCRHKEPNFFSRPGEVAADVVEYHTLFDESIGKIYGEASTTYSWFPQYPQTAQRIQVYNPAVKIIYIMRQPVERVRSHYTHRLLRARTRLPADQELFENPVYVNRSRYAVQLQPYLARFPRENIHLMIFEEYTADPLPALHTLAGHLGIAPKGFDGIDLTPQYQSSQRTGDKEIKKWLTPVSRLFPLKVRNALRGPFVYKPDRDIEFSEKIRQILWALVLQDVHEIEKLLGRKITEWRTPPYHDLGITNQELIV